MGRLLLLSEEGAECMLREEENRYTESILPIEKKKYIIFDSIYCEISNAKVHNMAWDEEQIYKV